MVVIAEQHDEEDKGLPAASLSMDEIRQFQSLLDEDDESDFEVVSSTKQRLDLLLASSAFEDEEDDEILVISSPARFTSLVDTNQKLEIDSGEGQVSQLAADSTMAYVLLFGILLAVGFLSLRFCSKIKSKHESLRREGDTAFSENTTSTHAHPGVTMTRTVRVETSSSSVAIVETTSPTESSTSRTTATTSNRRQELRHREDDMALSHSNGSEASTPPHLLCEGPTDERLVKIMQSSLRATPMDEIPMDTVAQTDDDDNRYTKIQLATKLAKDIKLVEQVLLEQGLDKSLAQQLAVGLQTSEAMLESQRQIESQRILVDAHHRTLDRQLSQRQHEETIHAAKYDPNWREKLQSKRDLCWNAVTRILLEVTISHHLIKLARPVLGVYHQDQTETILSFRQLLKLVIHSLCDCDIPNNQMSASRALSTYFFLGYQVVDVFQFFGAGIDSILMIDSGLCYGYCMASFTCIMLVTAMLHQALRVLSCPTILHHMINLIAITLCYGGSLLIFQNPMTWLVAILDVKFLTLTALLFWLMGVVQWTHWNSRRGILQNENVPSKFRESFVTSMDRMESLHLQLVILRYAMVAIYCSSFLFAETTTANTTIESHALAVSNE